MLHLSQHRTIMVIILFPLKMKCGCLHGDHVLRALLHLATHRIQYHYYSLRRLSVAAYMAIEERRKKLKNGDHVLSAVLDL